MIVAVTGAPGSGKSFMCVRLIAQALDEGKMVATNATMVEGWERKLARSHPARWLIPGRCASVESRYRDRSIYTGDLDELMRVRLGGRGEGRGVAVLDEAHEWLNNRLWAAEDRLRIIQWFSQHRKLGWDVYLVTQHLDSIDAQVRRLVEFHVVLRNLRRLRIAGLPVCPVNAFVAIWVWAGGPTSQRHVAKRSLFRLDGRRSLYDTFGLHLGDADVDEASDAVWLPRSERAGPVPAALPTPKAATPARAEAFNAMSQDENGPVVGRPVSDFRDVSRARRYESG